MEILPMLMPQIFVHQFLFNWWHEQCSMMSRQLTTNTYYYLKDLKHVYFTCWGLLYGKESQTLFIDNELSKAFQNTKCNGFFIESFKGHKLPKSKVQWLDRVTCLWPTLIRLPLASIIRIHYEIIIKYSKLCLNSFSPNYSWFMQYMKIDDGIISPLHLGMHSKPYDF